MLPPTFSNAGAFWIPTCAGVRLLGMTVWPVQTDNRMALRGNRGAGPFVRSGRNRARLSGEMIVCRRPGYSR